MKLAKLIFALAALAFAITGMATIPFGAPAKYPKVYHINHVHP